MKNMAKLTVIGVLLAAGAIQSHAQTTNIVRGLNIALTAYVQTSDGVVTVKRISTKDVIAAIAADDTNVTVSTKSKLILSTPAGGDGFAVLIRTTGAPDEDVTRFFDHSQIGDSVTKGTGATSTAYSIQEVAFHTTSGVLDFDVQGFTQSKNLNVPNAGPASMDKIAAAGIGDASDSIAVVKGTINTTGPKAEVVAP
jgi:hypothetical protein